MNQIILCQYYSLAMNVAIYIVGIISSIALVIMGTYVTYQNVKKIQFNKFF